MADTPQKRAYWLLNNKYRHVYIIDTVTQKDIFGAEVTMCTVKLTARTRERFEVEAHKLLNDKPHKSRRSA